MVFGIERLIAFYRKVRKDDPLWVIFYDKWKISPFDYTSKLPYLKCLLPANRHPGVLSATLVR